MQEEGRGPAAAAVVHLKSSCTIKPAGSTPTHPLWLSDVDQIMPFTHAPTVYFYRRSSSSSSSNDSTPFFSPDVMKSALSQALVKFYPLAGRLHHGPRGRLQLDCNAMGVLFVEAESNSQVDDFGDFTPRPGLRKLVPTVDYTTHIGSWPLLLAQLTFFRCGGVCLGLGVCHTLADGFAAMHFVSTWAGIARGDDAQNPGGVVDPFFDRTVLRARDPPPPAPAFEHPEFDPLPLLIGHDDDSELRRKETEVAMLKLSPEQVGKLRQAAPGCSRFLAVASHVWRSACRARRLHPDQVTKMSFAVDWRSRLRPPLPKGYFGNAAFVTLPSARSGELASEPLSATAQRVREALEKMSDEYLRSTLDFMAAQEDLGPYRRGSHTLGCGGRQGRFYGCPNMAFTSWLGLPLYDADFRWGPPAHMGPAAVGFDGKVFLMQSGEGLHIATRLMKEHMEAFKEIFYEGLL